MTARNRWLIGLALFAVYVIWGSTYLALRYLVEEFPPFIGNGIRFVVAGFAMFVFLRRRGAPAPTGREWWSAAQIGALLMMGGVGVVALAEARGVGSGLAATAVAAMPLWAALWGGLFGRWPNRLEWLGLAIGLTGVIILSREGDLAGNALGVTLMIAAPISWAFGSVWSQRITLPPGAMATAMEMATGGIILLIVGFVRGERFEAFPDLNGWLALVYLITLGSIVAFSAYMYLLNTVRPALATSYAYVNPVVAVLLGVTLGSEVLSGQALVALPLILGGVALVAIAKDRSTASAGPGDSTGYPGDLASPQIRTTLPEAVDQPNHCLDEAHAQIKSGDAHDQPENQRGPFLFGGAFSHGSWRVDEPGTG